MAASTEDPLRDPTAGRGWAISGLIVMAASILGVAQILHDASRTMVAMGNDPAAEAKEAAYFHALRWEVAAWIAPGAIGVILVCIALMKARNRERWFFLCTLFLIFNWLLFFFPYGIFLAVVFLRKWKEFSLSSRSLTGGVS
jgi:hypothetical protein